MTDTPVLDNKTAADPALSIYALKAGLRYGPYSRQELQEQLECGFFGPQDFASCDQNKTWMPIAEVPGVVMPGFVVESEQADNLLIIRYYGRVTATAVEHCLARVRAELEKLEPDFRLLADFTELESMDAACVAPLEKIMEACNEKGVSAVVRIIPDLKRDIGLQIMSPFHYGPHVRIATCASLEEAKSRL